MPKRPEDEAIPMDPKELVKSADIWVTQARITGEYQFGRPTTELLETRVFDTLKRAFEWTCENPQYLYTFQLPEPQIQIDVKLIGTPGSQDEKLVVYSRAEKAGVGSRTVEGHHSVSAEDQEVSSINIELLPNQRETFEGGLAWFILDEDIPSIMVSVKPGAREPYWLHAQFLMMTARVVSVLDDLTKGKP